MARRLVISAFDGSDPSDDDFRAKTGVCVLAVSSDETVVDRLRRTVAQIPVGPETRMIEQACRDAALAVIRPDVSDLQLPVAQDLSIPIRVVVGEPSLPLLTIDSRQARAVPVARVLPRAPRLSVIRAEDHEASHWKSVAAFAAAAILFLAVFLIH